MIKNDEFLVKLNMNMFGVEIVLLSSVEKKSPLL